MSLSEVNDTEDVIHHIDDTYEEQYVESFAPKAQEEALSETQDSNQACNGEQSLNQNENSNVSVDISNKSESSDLLNDEELNATSNQLIEDVMTNVETNMVLKDEVESEVVVDNEPIEADEDNMENDVVMEEQSEVVESHVNETEKFAENVNVDNENDVMESEPINEEPSQSEDLVENENENTSAEVPLVENTPNVEEIKSDEKSSTGSERKSGDSHIKGKDIKSLSSSYKHEDNMTNGDCYICNKKVYPMEKYTTNDRLFHKTCFRCTKCKSSLTSATFTFNQGKPYCTPHYVELFKKRGRYDETDDNKEVEKPTATESPEVLTNELPAPDTTKNIVKMFADKESGNVTNQTLSSEPAGDLPPPNTTKNMKERYTALCQEKTEVKCKPKIDIPRHTNGHSNGTSENVPVQLSGDVVRANDPAQDEKPEEGITKNLVNRFREMENLSNN